MSEEEKEAIDDCKNFMNVGDYIGEKEYKELQIAMNYIDKLEKENTELKEKNKYQYELLGKFEEHIDKETIMNIYDEE